MVRFMLMTTVKGTLVTNIGVARQKLARGTKLMNMEFENLGHQVKSMPKGSTAMRALLMTLAVCQNPQHLHLQLPL